MKTRSQTRAEAQAAAQTNTTPSNSRHNNNNGANAGHTIPDRDRFKTPDNHPSASEPGAPKKNLERHPLRPQYDSLSVIPEEGSFYQSFSSVGSYTEWPPVWNLNGGDGAQSSQATTVTPPQSQGESAEPLKSPFTTPKALRRNFTHLENGPDGVQAVHKEAVSPPMTPTTKLRRQALGPHGTMLIHSDGTPMYVGEVQR